jgi:hypothetical protein
MNRKLLLLILLTVVGSFMVSNGLPARPARNAEPVYGGLTVHEWGTFTSIAGQDGQAVEWSPLTGSTDLPGFVDHFRTPEFKLGLRGKVRMETPVLYFYDSREEQVSVKVNFVKGLITEWYPRASRGGAVRRSCGLEYVSGERRRQHRLGRGHHLAKPACRLS